MAHHIHKSWWPLSMPCGQHTQCCAESCALVWQTKLQILVDVFSPMLPRLDAALERGFTDSERKTNTPWSHVPLQCCNYTQRCAGRMRIDMARQYTNTLALFLFQVADAHGSAGKHFEDVTHQSPNLACMFLSHVKKHTQCMAGGPMHRYGTESTDFWLPVFFAICPTHTMTC